MHCNVFFNFLAAHMLSSETCMLASQELLSNKRVQNEDDEESMYETSPTCNLHGKSVAKKSCQLNNNVASISTTEHSFSLSPNIFQQTSVDNIVGDDKAFMNHPSLDDHSINSVLHTRESDCSDNDMESSSTENSCDQSIASVKVFPIESNIFNQAFTPEVHFMIKLCNVCEEANAPLDLVDKTVDVIHDTQNNALNMESNIVHLREHFLKHLNKQFNVPQPESIDISIEHTLGNDQTIHVI